MGQTQTPDQQLRPLGYQPDELVGKVGVEAGLESVLRGTDGWADVVVDAQYAAYVDLTGKTTPLENQTVPLGAKPILLQCSGGVAPTMSPTLGAVTNAASSALAVAAR